MRYTPEAADYEGLLAETLDHWQEAIYDGVLIQHVVGAVRIFAHASLDTVAERPDTAKLFPLSPDGLTIHEHYANAIFVRLSAACTSIRSALQAIQARMDGHSAIAIARRANESVWQASWLFDPDADADERVKRLLILTRTEITDALRVFDRGVNLDVERELRSHEAKLRVVVKKTKYVARLGREAYESYFDARVNDPVTRMAPAVPEGADSGDLAWRMMSNLTHPNLVFDLIQQSQPEFQHNMDRLQLMCVGSAVSGVSNLCTVLANKAPLPDNQVKEVNTAFRLPIFAIATLIGTQRE